MLTARPSSDLLALQRLVDRSTWPRAERGPVAMHSAEVHQTAQLGTRGASQPLPFLDTIQRSFGRHDVSGIAAHTDQAAASAARAIDATAFTTGNHVAFAEQPSLSTAAHEAAHVIQQRGGVQLEGGVGAAGDRYERHADAVADQVVQGKSAEGLLDRHVGTAGPSVQREGPTGAPQGPAPTSSQPAPPHLASAPKSEDKPAPRSVEGSKRDLQRKAVAIRFQDEPTLDEISDGRKILKEGNKGEAVIRVTTALAELGHYTISIIDESFDPPLTSAVTAFQTAKKLTGVAVDGAVDRPTFTALDTDFANRHKVERDVIAGQKTAALGQGTQTLNDAERVASARAISTETTIDPVTGILPTFKPFIAGKGHYKDRLHKAVEDEIIAQYDSMGKNKAAAHADPTKLYDWTLVEKIATESQKAVEAVFGEYTKAMGPARSPLKKGVNIFDAWDDKASQQLAGGAAWEEQSAKWRVSKILAGDPAVRSLDKEHGAIQSRSEPAKPIDEKRIVQQVKNDLVIKHRAKLIETHKGWPGYADPDNSRIFIQRFQSPSMLGKRRDMWEFFQTFIHEYIHTLEHKDYNTYRKSLDEQKGGFTLREGATEYFTKVVWDGVAITDALRAAVEGPFHDPINPIAIPPLNAYDEADNAERLAGIVGTRNLAAAFFLGKVELIGKK